MGIINVTPDSFSDGGEFLDASTRRSPTPCRWRPRVPTCWMSAASRPVPGAQPVALAEELRRVVPVIQAVAAVTDVPISIDTMKADVAEAALAAGAQLRQRRDGAARRSADGGGGGRRGRAGVPDAHAGRAAHDAATTRATTRGRRGRASSWPSGRSGRARRVSRPTGSASIPGIGFGKTLAHNLELLRRLDEIVALGYPVVVGVSRKRFLGALTGCG